MTSQANGNSEQFPVAHLRSHLDEQFSFRADDSLVDNVEGMVSSQSGLQSILANESWYQVSLHHLYFLEK